MVINRSNGLWAPTALLQLQSVAHFNNTFLTFALFAHTICYPISKKGIECLNEINWLVKYWYGFVFRCRRLFRCDTIDILSEFWFLGTLEAFILSLSDSWCVRVIDIQDDRANWSAFFAARVTKGHFNLPSWMQCDYLPRHYEAIVVSESGINGVILGQILVGRLFCLCGWLHDSFFFLF